MHLEAEVSHTRRVPYKDLTWKHLIGYKQNVQKRLIHHRRLKGRNCRWEPRSSCIAGRLCPFVSFVGTSNGKPLLMVQITLQRDVGAGKWRNEEERERGGEWKSRRSKWLWWSWWWSRGENRTTGLTQPIRPILAAMSSWIEQSVHSSPSSAHLGFDIPPRYSEWQYNQRVQISHLFTVYSSCDLLLPLKLQFFTEYKH